MHRARKGRDLNVGVLGAEADGIREVARIATTTVTVRGALNAASEAQLAALADELSR